MRLYELSNEYQRLLDAVSQCSDMGEIDAPSLELLNEIEDEFSNKAIAISSYIGNLKAEWQAVTDAAKAMQARAKSLSAKMASLESYLETNMTATGITEITASPYFTIKLKKCPASVNITDESLLPIEYMTPKTTMAPNKTKIAADIKAGDIVPGAVLVNKLRVEIK